MQHNYSLENQITNGVVQYVEEIKTDLNSIKVIFQDINTGRKTSFEVIGFNNFSIVLDSPECIVKDIHDFTQRALIGLSYEEKSDRYIYCVKTDDYEVMFESKNVPKITQL
jgi:hypothetical protein